MYMKILLSIFYIVKMQIFKSSYILYRLLFWVVGMNLHYTAGLLLMLRSVSIFCRNNSHIQTFYCAGVLDDQLRYKGKNPALCSCYSITFYLEKLTFRSLRNFHQDSMYKLEYVPCYFCRLKVCIPVANYFKI